MYLSIIGRLYTCISINASLSLCTTRLPTSYHHYHRCYPHHHPLTTPPMPQSPNNSQEGEEDVELPDAPASPLSDTPPKLPKTEPTSDPAIEHLHLKKDSDDEGAIKLEDIFTDDDEDFLGGTDDADLIASEVGAGAAPLSVKPSPRASDPEVMLAFYQRLFPFRQLFQWLNHSQTPCNDFGHREFAFTLQNDAYLRYQAFPTFETLRKEILRLNPSRFEIGPVYTANPRDRKVLSKAVFKPLEKELVFDIDLTDYDEVRTCCDKANICIKCWQFITIAIKIMNKALKDDFGFKHIMWVYSGRRGAHAWVCDKRARVLDDSKRRAIASYLEVIKGGSQAGKKVNVKRPLHPHLSRSLGILKDHFGQNVLLDQDPWKETEQAEKLLALLPIKEINDALRKKWDSQYNRPSIDKWKDINAVAGTGLSGNYTKTQIAQLEIQLKEHKEDVRMEYMYPRLDAEVSKHLNHLLKSPFCVHPGTGRVCVPIDSTKLEDFDPMGVPTVTQLLREIDTWNGGHSGEKDKIADYEKTSLKPYVNLFKAFVAGLLRDEPRERDRDKMEF